jgi:hypothetical protein
MNSDAEGREPDRPPHSLTISQLRALLNWVESDFQDYAPPPPPRPTVYSAAYPFVHHTGSWYADRSLFYEPRSEPEDVSDKPAQRELKITFKRNPDPETNKLVLVPTSRTTKVFETVSKLFHWVETVGADDTINYADALEMADDLVEYNGEVDAAEADREGTFVKDGNRLRLLKLEMKGS